MSNILITGGTGFLGRSLIPKLRNGRDKIFMLTRDDMNVKAMYYYSFGGEPVPDDVFALKGNILLPNLGVDEKLPQIDKLVHMAAVLSFSETDHLEEIWNTNVQGTKNVISFCKDNDIPHLLFVSSAYTHGRNTYERSKSVCESLIAESVIPKITIYKPSILVGNPPNYDFLNGTIVQFILSLIKVHRRADIVRRKFEGLLRLPVIELVARIDGNPSAKLNLIRVSDVAQGICRFQEPGTFWLTHPNPPTLRELAEWVGEASLLNIKYESFCKYTPLERFFQKLTKAFLPYLWGDSLPSDLDVNQVGPIDKDLIQHIVYHAVKNID